MTTRPRPDIGSLIVSLLFVAIGALTLRDTVGYMDFDSKIFPRAAGIALIVAGAASALLSLLRPAGVDGLRGFHWWRPILLLVAMLAAAALMRRIGFLPASIIVFAGGLIAGMENRWTARLLILCVLASLVIVTACYALFKYALYVPLP